MSEIIDKDNLIRKIADGASPGAILLSMLPESQRLSLASCALVRFFDADFFRNHLAHGGANLDELVGLRLIERLDDEGGWYGIAPGLRDDAWELWWLDQAADTPQPLADAAARLADCYRQPDRPIERLRQLVICNITAAEDLFRSVYEEADHRFDLARCQDAVDALTKFGRDRFLLRSPLGEYRDDCQRRIWARSTWATDFLQTADIHFQPRPTAQSKLIELIESGKRGQWLLQLHGDGGIGKTMLLRRFISQVCVAKDPMIACARIDGDAVDPVVLLDCPWLLLLEAAAQLDTQLRDAPFYTLLNSYGSYRSLLRRVPQDTTVTSKPESPLGSVGEDIKNAFCRALAVGSRVLIVVDTLDDIVELSRSTPKLLTSLITLISEVHKAAPAVVRVVLAGREDLQLVPGVRLPKRVIDCPLGAFSEQEARSYLEGRRKITERDKVTAIIRKCDGTPYLVAGFADEVENDPSLTAEAIDKIDKPIVNYMNDRVLMRIGDRVVAWSLRYSVVPPVLSFEFFRDVMLPEFRETGPDDPFLSAMAGRAQANAGPYGVTRAAPAQADADAIERRWRSVLAHAGKVRWMSAESPVGQNLVIVNSKVRDVLRAHVRDEPAFMRMHERAIGHYRALIDAHDGKDYPPEWLSWTKAVLFHGFHLAQSGADGEWRAAMAQARMFGRMDWVRELAAYLPGPDFQDAGGQPAIIPAQVLYEAHVELAHVVAQCAGRLPGPPWTGSVLWPDEARAALTLAQEMLDTPGSQITPVDIHADLQALLSVEDERSAGSADPIVDAIGADRTTAEAWLVRARGYARGAGGAGPSDLAEHVLVAYRRARAAYGDDLPGVEYVDSEAGEWLLAHDRADLAIGWSEDSDLPSLRAGALLALGRPSSALRALPCAARSLREGCLAAKALRDLRQPVAALRELTADGAASADTDPVALRIERELIMARANAELFDLDAAERCFGQAQALVNDADELNNARVHIAAALFHLRTVRDVRQAANDLDQDFQALPEEEPEWTRFWLAKAELADRRGRVDEVKKILRHVRDSLIARDVPASRRVEVALAGLAVRSDGWSDLRPEYLAALADDLELVVRVAARLAMLTELRRCPPVGPCPAATRLRALVIDAGDPDDDGDELDKAWQDLTRAHLLRVIGDNDGYYERRDSAWWTLQKEERYIGWELLEADAVFGRRQALGLGLGLEYLDQSYSDHPMLVARFMTEWVDQYGDTIARPDRRLEVAEKLAVGQLDQTVCGGRLYEVQAKYTYRNDSELAARLAAKANAVWSGLGDPRRVRDNGELGDLELTKVVVPTAVSEVRIRADQKGSDILIHLRSGPSADRPFRAHTDDFATARRWMEVDPPSWGNIAGAKLSGGLVPVLPPRASSQKLDVHVEFPSPALAAFPWELAEIGDVPLAGHHGVRYIARSVDGAYQGRREVLYQQRLLEALDIPVGLPDGIPGVLYRSGIDQLNKLPDQPGNRPLGHGIWAKARAALQARQGPGRLSVLVVQPVVGGALDLLRRVGERTKQLERSYRTAFPDGSEGPGPMLTFGDVTGGDAARLLAPNSEQQPVDVLHLCTVMEATEQLPVLGLDYRAGPPIDAAEVDQMVRGLTGTVPPLVILDILPPPSPVDVRRQLLMRNRFAHQLLALGSVDTIIATGFADRETATEQWQCIAEGLADRLSAAEICRKIHDLGAVAPPGAAAPADPLAYAATAFFTAVHPDVLVEPGLLSDRDDVQSYG